jgi:cob(I)alamin adenosyltransferase
MKEGKIHIYYGDGKGKTTSALGLVMRSLGWNKKVVVFFLLKPLKTGEVKFLTRIPKVKIFCYRQVHPIFWKKSREKYEWKRLLAEVKKALKDIDVAIKGNYDLIVLDEILNLLDLGLITKEYIIDIFNSKTKKTELVLTGRKCPRVLRKYAHYLSEIRFRKNPFYENEKPRRGIEY